MSSGDDRKVSREDIQLVQNLIERCLQLYMNQKEVVDTLSYQAKIEPGFTELVWQKLEEENKEFFKAYNVRLLLKNQILIFNKLLEKQVELMHKVCPPGVASVPLSNGPSSSALQQTPSFLSDQATTSSKPDNMFCNGGSSLVTMNVASLENQSTQPADDVSQSLLSAHIGMPNGINGAAIKAEPSYSNNSDFNFFGDSSFLETRPPLGVEPGTSFGNSELSGQQLNDLSLDIDSSSFGFLSQIPRNFSFSDLTDDFTQSADILENYGRSPFLGHEVNSFSVSPGRDFKDEDRRLDTISEGVSYDDFGSD